MLLWLTFLVFYPIYRARSSITASEEIERKLDLLTQEGFINENAVYERCVVYGNDASSRDEACEQLKPRYKWIDPKYDAKRGIIPELGQAIVIPEGTGALPREEVCGVNDNNCISTWRVLHPCTYLNFETNDVELDRWQFGNHDRWKNIDTKKLFKAINSTGWVIASYGASSGYIPYINNFGSIFYIGNDGHFFTCEHVLNHSSHDIPLSSSSGAMKSILYPLKKCSFSYDLGYFRYYFVYYGEIFGYTDTSAIEIVDDGQDVCHEGDDIVLGQMKNLKIESSLRIPKQTDLCDVGAQVLCIGHPTHPRNDLVLKDGSYLSADEASNIMYSGRVIVGQGEITDVDLRSNTMRHTCVTGGGMSGTVIVSVPDPTLVCGMHIGVPCDTGLCHNSAYHYTYPLMQKYAP